MRKVFLSVSAIFLVVLALSFPACNDEDRPATGDSNQADTVSQLVDKGRYIATHVTVCIDCHSKRDFTKFSLPPVPGTEGIGASFPFGEAEGIPGEIWPPNITPARLSSWTDEEITRAITRGISKTGDTLFPIMPYHNYANLAKEDLDAIVAYIRTLPSSDSTVPPRVLHMPLSALPPLPSTDIASNNRPPKSDTIAYGGYLTRIASCGDCHTPMTPQGGPDFSKAFSGGFVFKTPAFKVAVSNITPDSATGIGSWTADAFVAKFRNNSSPEMVNKNPGAQQTVMPWAMYGGMKEEDLRAIYAYLRSLPPVSNKVEKWPK